MTTGNESKSSDEPIRCRFLQRHSTQRNITLFNAIGELAKGHNVHMDLEPDIVTDDQMERILPSALIEHAQAWLVLQETSNDFRCLVVSITQVDRPSTPKPISEIRPVLTDLFGVARQPERWDERANRWVRILGTDTVRRHFAYAIMQFDQQVEEILSDGPTLVKGKGGQEVIHARSVLEFGATVNAGYRDKALSKLLNATDVTRLEDVKKELDTSQERILRWTANRILATTNSELAADMRILLDEFDGVLDASSKKFLVSADIVAQAISAYESKRFDHALPGCGLWKAIEREANTSIVALVRYAENIIDRNALIDHQFTPLQNRSSAKVLAFPLSSGSKYRGVDLNQVAGSPSPTLKSLQLGDIQAILANIRGTALYREGLLRKVLQDDSQLLLFLERSMAESLGSVAKLRNEHAHVQPMNKDNYEKLRKHIVQAGASESTLKRLLRLKDYIHHYMDVSPPETT